MNWLAFAFIAWVVTGLEAGVKDQIAYEAGGVVVAPSFALVLAAFVAMAAPPAAASWACLVLGLLVDLTSVRPLAAAPALTVVGPHALGFLLAGQFVLAARWVMIRRSPVSLGLLSLGAALIANIAVVALFTVRKVLGDPLVWNATQELLGGLGSAVYTGLLGAVLSLVLIPLTPAFSFHAGARGHIPRRSFERR